MMFVCLLYLFLLTTSRQCYVDYWSEGFADTNNCQDEDLMRQLMNEQNPKRCAEKMQGITQLMSKLHNPNIGGW